MSTNPNESAGFMCPFMILVGWSRYTNEEDVRAKTTVVTDACTTWMHINAQEEHPIVLYEPVILPCTNPYATKREGYNCGETPTVTHTLIAFSGSVIRPDTNNQKDPFVLQSTVKIADFISESVNPDIVYIVYRDILDPAQLIHVIKNNSILNLTKVPKIVESPSQQKPLDGGEWDFVH